jgi:hypothetical protein
MTTTYRKSYDPEYVRTRNLEYYNVNIKADPEKYADKKKQIKEYMVNRYKNDPEYREKQLQRQREYYERKKSKIIKE